MVIFANICTICVKVSQLCGFDLKMCEKYILVVWNSLASGWPGPVWAMILKLAIVEWGALFLIEDSYKHGSGLAHGDLR